MLKQPAGVIGRLRFRAKAEMMPVQSSLNLYLDLNLLHSLRPCWAGFLNILLRRLLLLQTYHIGFPRPANVLAPGVPDRLRLSK